MSDLTITKYIAQPLTPERKAELHEEIVRAVNDKRRIEELLEEYVKTHKKIIKAREATIEENAETLAQGHIMVPVKCNQEVDFNTNTLRIIRNDTNAVLEERALTTQERMQLLDQREPATSTNGHGRRRR